MENIKLVVFDLNKTLIHENSWYELNLAMGMTAEEDELIMKWCGEGIITYEQSMDLLSKLYRKRGDASRGNIERVLFDFTYLDGAKEIIKYLRNKEYELAIISSSMDMIAGKVAEDLEVKYYATNNLIRFDDDDYFVKYVTVGDEAITKRHQLESICEDLNIELNQAVCIGDGDNDLMMFEASGHGITFDWAEKEVRDKAWQIIKSLPDLKNIL